MATLKHDLPTLGLFCLGFGTITGVGWILLMGPWLQDAGSLGSMLAFAIGAIAIVFISLCYAELCAKFPVAGGEIVFNFEAYGLVVAFVTGWFIALTYISGIAYEAIAVGWLITDLVPELKGRYLYSSLGHDIHAGPLAIGLLFMGLIGWLNAKGVRGVSRIQVWVTMTFIAVSALFVFFAIFRGDIENLHPLYSGSSGLSAREGLFSVLAVTPFFYVGFNVIAQAMGERSESLRPGTTTLVLVGCVVAAAVFYLLVIVATAIVLPRDELLADALPVSTAFQAAFGSVALGKAALIVGILGLLTTWNALYFAAGRVLLGFGRASLLPKPFTAVSESSGTPSVALLFTGIIGALGTFLGQGAIIPIFNAMSGAMCVVFLLVCVAVIRLRKKDTQADARYRMPGGQATPVIGAVFATVLALISFGQALVGADGGFPVEYSILLTWLILGYVFWQWSGTRRKGVSREDRRRMMLEN
ncbi:MAG TPA: APC family permease [Woeseiaceae bacterium]|nr:APC family permease [Woeseiaceae bacterium]